MADELDAFGRRKEKPSVRRERSPPRSFREERKDDVRDYARFERRDDRRDDRRIERRDERRPRDERDERRRVEPFFEGDRRFKDGRDLKRRSSLSPRVKGARSPPAKRPVFDVRDRGRGYPGLELDPHRKAPIIDDRPPPRIQAVADFPRHEPMLTYKQFILDLDDNVSPTEAEKRYAEYKSQYMNSQKLAFFFEHKNDNWLRDKYDPIRVEELRVRRNENARTVAREFLDVLKKNGVNIDSAAGSHNEDPKTQPPPAVPSSAEDPSRVSFDTKQALDLSRKLDPEKSIEGNFLLSAATVTEGDSALSFSINREGSNFTLKGVELLDTVVTYLWKVHGVDYYGGKELKQLPRGLRTVRSSVTSENPEQKDALDWAAPIDKKWKARLSGEAIDPLVELAAAEKVEEINQDLLQKSIRKIQDEKYGWKYGCWANNCAKLFHAPEFVLKHVKTKHGEVLDETLKLASDEVFKNNFLRDPDAPVPDNFTPSRNFLGAERYPDPNFRPQGRPPREQERGDREYVQYTRGFHSEPPKKYNDRLSVMDPDPTRSYDRDRLPDRGPGRDRFGDREGEHIDPGFHVRGGRPPLDDGFPKEGGAFMGDFDAFDGANPLLEPPQMLIPIPGAGPLGPFVPAPPEVALRMMREQNMDGFDVPFVDDGLLPMDRATSARPGGGRGGGRRPGGMRRDPRHVRSYKDLDAPEDEVPVMDYRSL